MAAASRLAAPRRDYVRVVDGWLRRQIADGQLVDGPFTVLHALWLAATQEFCRQWSVRRSRLRPRNVADQLAVGAWQALRPS
jgi:hypothetical protein